MNNHKNVSFFKLGGSNSQRENNNTNLILNCPPPNLLAGIVYIARRYQDFDGLKFEYTQYPRIKDQKLLQDDREFPSLTQFSCIPLDCKIFENCFQAFSVLKPVAFKVYCFVQIYNKDLEQYELRLKKNINGLSYHRGMGGLPENSEAIIAGEVIFNSDGEVHSWNMRTTAYQKKTELELLSALSNSLFPKMLWQAHPGNSLEAAVYSDLRKIINPYPKRPCSPKL